MKRCCLFGLACGALLWRATGSFWLGAALAPCLALLAAVAAEAGRTLREDWPDF